MANKLYIYGGVDDYALHCSKEDNNFVYNINSGRIRFCNDVVKNINDTKRVHEIALEQRSRYADYIYDINQEFIKYRLAIHDQLSCYFIADLSNKRSEIYFTYSHLCHLLYLQQYLRDNIIDEIECISCPDEFVEGIRSIYANKLVLTGRYVLFKRHIFLMRVLKQLVYFSKFAIKRLIGSCIHCPTKLAGTIDKLFLTFYPVHLSAEGKESKYGEYVSANDTFLVSILADGYLCHPSLREYIVYLKKLALIGQQHKIILLDALVSMRDIVVSFLYAIKICMQGQVLINKKFVYYGIDLSGYLRYEMEHSLNRIPKIAIYDRAMDELFSNVRVDSFYYYLFEYSFGRFMTWACKFYSPRTISIGYQHGPAAWRKCLYSISKREVDHESKDYTHYLPLPDKVLAENKLAKEILEDARYINVSIMSQIYRLHYLENVKRELSEKNMTLVATGLHDSIDVVHHLKKICAGNRNITFYLKVHPKVNSETIRKIIRCDNYSNVVLAEKSLEYYLSRVDHVMITYSSVGNEAYALGIPVTLLCMPSRINESTLMDISDNNISIKYINE